MGDSGMNLNEFLQSGDVGATTASGGPSGSGGDDLLEAETLLAEFDEAKREEAKEEEPREETALKVGFERVLQHCENELNEKWKELLARISERSAHGDVSFEDELGQVMNIWNPNRACLEVEFKRVEREARDIVDELAAHGLSLNTLSVALSENVSWKMELQALFARENVATWSDFQERLGRSKQAVTRLKEVLIAQKAEGQKTKRLEEENAHLRTKLEEAEKRLKEPRGLFLNSPNVFVQGSSPRSGLGDEMMASRTLFAQQDSSTRPPFYDEGGRSFDFNMPNMNESGRESGRVKDEVASVFDSVMRDRRPEMLTLRASVALGLPDVSKFSGDGGDPFTEWLMRFLMKYGATVYDEKCVMVQLKEKLSGKARDIFDGLDSQLFQNGSLEELCKALYHKLTSANAGQQFRSLIELFRCEYKGERVAEFIRKVDKLVMRALPKQTAEAESILKSGLLLKGLKGKWEKNHYELVNILETCDKVTAYKKLCDAVLTIESSLESQVKLREVDAQASPIRVNARPFERSLNCFECNQPGHRKSECPRLIGESSSPTPAGNVKREFAGQSNTQSHPVGPRKDDRPQYRTGAVSEKGRPATKGAIVKLNDESCGYWALIDTGSEVSLIDAKLYEEVVNQPLNTTDHRLVGVNGDGLDVQGEKEIRVYMEGQDATLNFFVVSDLCEQIIIGWPDMIKVGVQCTTPVERADPSPCERCERMTEMCGRVSSAGQYEQTDDTATQQETVSQPNSHCPYIVSLIYDGRNTNFTEDYLVLNHKIEGKVIIDMDSEISLMSEDYYKRIFKGPLKPTKAKLQTMNEKPLKASGEHLMNVRLHECEKEVNFVICPDIYENIVLGASDLKRLGPVFYRRPERQIECRLGIINCESESKSRMVKVDKRSWSEIVKGEKDAKVQDERKKVEPLVKLKPVLVSRRGHISSQMHAKSVSGEEKEKLEEVKIESKCESGEVSLLEGAEKASKLLLTSQASKNGMEIRSSTLIRFAKIDGDGKATIRKCDLMKELCERTKRAVDKTDELAALREKVEDSEQGKFRFSCGLELDLSQCQIMGSKVWKNEGDCLKQVISPERLQELARDRSRDPSPDFGLINEDFIVDDIDDWTRSCCEDDFWTIDRTTPFELDDAR